MNREMRRLIRSIVEVSWEEGYEISYVQNEIARTFNTYIVDKEKERVQSWSLIEPKLLALFKEAWPREDPEERERYVALCFVYYGAKKREKEITPKEIIKELSAKINLTVGHLNGKLRQMTCRLAKTFLQKESERFFEKDGSMKWGKSIEILEAFYQNYMIN